MGMTMKSAADPATSYALYACFREATVRPLPFAVYSADTLWTDHHISGQMLACHLDPDIDAASRSHAFIDASVAWIFDRFDVSTNTKMADFGCGPGLYCQRFAEQGASVTGVDFSVNSLNHARRQAEDAGLPIEYVESDYLSFETDRRFDIISLIYCDLCALGPSQRLELLRRFRRWLTRDGVLLFDVHTVAAFETRGEFLNIVACPDGGFWSKTSHFEIHAAHLYLREKLSLDLYTIVEDGRTWQVYNWLQHFDHVQIARELAEAGFEVETVYGDVCGAPFDATTPDMAIVARPV
ncbi:MAG: class I SAM-dependent methyltransferase [Gemmatimonadetes bacterium]|jgi:SAM-dependent methyltransferase|nr:class I SAM-dependent methyltransferase [Gemmatimonadota bacterium]MBT6149085.1 class I SAM-dependent methyltransferase [Gemmatimonadota bacterium]MBT7863917.1 class I SAM-dependent methyltransferase [Gemmatimonadota bacterium]